MGRMGDFGDNIVLPSAYISEPDQRITLNQVIAQNQQSFRVREDEKPGVEKPSRT